MHALNNNEIDRKTDNRSDAIWQARINNPDLNQSDRNLINRFKKGEVSKQTLFDTYYKLLEEQVRTYDGKTSLTNSRTAKRIAAFEWILHRFIEQEKISEQEFNSKGREIFEKYLSPEDNDLLRKYQASIGRPLPERIKLFQAILNRALSYPDKFSGEIWGTRSKIAAFQQSTAFSFARPLNIQEDLDVLSYLKLLGLHTTAPRDAMSYRIWKENIDFIKTELITVDDALNIPEKIADQRIKQHVMDKFKMHYFTLLQYLNGKNLDPRQIDLLSTLMSFYASAMRKIGISQAKFEALQSEVEKYVEKPEVKQVDLGSIKQPIAVTPEAMPRHVIQMLEKVRINGMSGYQFLKENVKLIILTPHIFSSGTDYLTGEDGPLGSTRMNTSIIQIDVYDETRHTPRTAFDLINTIMHETYHVYWMKNHYNDPKMLSSTINEGVANLAGLTASRDIVRALSPQPGSMSLLGPRPKEVLDNLEKEIQITQATIGGAIQVLGLDPAKLPMDISIPKFLEASLRGNSENDTDTYPTSTPYFVAQQLLTSVGENVENRAKLTPIIERIVKGESLLSLSGKDRELLHHLLAKIDPRFGKMKYEEVINELRGLFGYYVWKGFKPVEDSYRQLPQFLSRDTGNRDIKDELSRSREHVQRQVREVKAGKSDDQILMVLSQIFNERNSK